MAEQKPVKRITGRELEHGMTIVEPASRGRFKVLCKVEQLSRPLRLHKAIVNRRFLYDNIAPVYVES